MRFALKAKRLMTACCLVSFFQLSFGQTTAAKTSTSFRSERVPVVSVVPISVEDNNIPDSCLTNTSNEQSAEDAKEQGCVAQKTVQRFKAIYELNGQLFSVILPNDPGEFLELQIQTPSTQDTQDASMQSTPNSTAAVLIKPGVPYNSTAVIFLGLNYRPFPFFGSVSRSYRPYFGMRHHSYGRHGRR